MAALRAGALATLLVLACAPLAFSAPSASALAPSDLLQLPRLAIGFSWTYHFAGATDVNLGGFRATYMTDTYTSAIVSQASPARGEAWVVRNNHAGTLSGIVPPGIPSTGTFTSVSFTYLRKADLAVLNATYDTSVTATVPIIGSISGSGHNDTYANPPLVQVAFGSPADGTPWRIVSNLTDTGWYKIGAAAQVNTYSYFALDYNLSVTGIETANVPAGLLPSYNITGGGTADNNGTLTTFTQGFLYAPVALNKAVDEAGYSLQSFSVNRAPVVSSLPSLDVDAGAWATLNLTPYVSDPDGDPFTLSCAPSPPLGCSVAPNGTLTVSADPGLNLTLLLNLTANDGRPVGDTTFPLTVLVRDPGSPNRPPVWVGPSTLSMTEDVDGPFALLDLAYDPDDSNLTFALRPAAPLIVLVENATHFTLHAPPNFNGFSSLNMSVFDGAGNALVTEVAVQVLAVNDPPTIRALTDTTLFVHSGGNVTASVALEDIDRDTLALAWLVDGSLPGLPATEPNFTYPSPSADQGTHTLTAQVRDGGAVPVSLDFRIEVFVGPALTFHSPAGANLRVASGSTLAFEVRAADPDTPTLNYTWSKSAVVLHSGANQTHFSLTAVPSAPFDVLGLAADNGSSVGFLWHITVEQVPADLVSILAPAAGSTFPANATVALSALVDPRLSDLNISWSLDGTVFWHAEDARTGPLRGPSNHTVTLEVSGLYNATVPYSVRLTVNFTVLAPPASNSTGGNGGNGGTAPPSSGDFLLPLLLVAALVGAALALLLRQRRRREPPA